MSPLKRRAPSLILILLCAALPARRAGAQQPQPGRLAVAVNEKGAVSIDVNIAPPPTTAKLPGRSRLLIVALPLALDLAGKNLSTPTLRIVPLRASDGSTLLALIFPADQAQLSFRFEDVAHVKESKEGKALLEFDVAYVAIPQPERGLVDSPDSASAFDLSVSLPEDYDPKEVSFSPPSMTRAGKVYSLDYAQAKQAGASKVWVTFPNPIKHVTQRAMLIITFLLSCLGIWIELKAFEEKDFKWPLGVFIIALIVLAVASYYAYALAGVVEFSIFLAGCVPQVVYGLAASVYQLAASRWQGVVVGEVSIGAKTTHRADVVLYQIAGGKEIQAGRTTTEKGYYKLRVWLGNPPRTYQVNASVSFTEPGRSKPFQLLNTEPYQVELIELKPRISDPPSGAEGESFTSGVVPQA